MINALNSGAKVFMADLEDALSPTWENVIEGQANLMDAVRRTLSLDSPEGKHYELNERTATLVVRPRGWHLVESHASIDGVPMSASLFDFGLYFFHNARELVARGTGPTSTCRRPRAISRSGFGTMFFASRRTRSAFRRGRFAPLC